MQRSILKTGGKSGSPTRARRAGSRIATSLSAARSSHRLGNGPLKTSAHNRYVPALDGLRALAVLAVIAYHMGMGWAPGGLMGVTIFFVLSGYLITSILLAEHEDTSTISLSSFWLRRVRRIVPAVVFAVLGTAALCTIFDHALLTKMRPDVLPTLLFYNNWWQIFSDASYFDTLGEASPLAHCWSLSIEEQFYLIWPVALLLCLKFGVKRAHLEKGTLVLILLSALAMAIQYDPKDPTFVYYGTHTRAFSLLIGAFLAFVWPYRNLDDSSGKKLGNQERLIFDGVGIAAIVGLIIMIVTVSGYSAFNYYGGQLLCSLLAAVAMAVMVHPVSLLGRFFALKPFVWIGKISYSMYLWHYPIILLMTPNNLVSELPIWLRLVQLVVIIGMSALSYYFVENPVRHGAVEAFVAELRSGSTSIVSWAQEHMPYAIAGGVITLIALGGFLFVPNTSSVESAALYQENSTESASAEGAGETGDEAAAAEDEDRFDILLIGDSVSVRAIPYFEDLFPYGRIDSVINRQMDEAPGIYAWYRDEELVGDIVVFSLGTNGYVTDEDIDNLMAEVGDEKYVWFITARASEDYVEDNNDALRRAADRYSNVSVIDWYSLSEDEEDYFDGDGTHLTEEAAEIYAEMIYEAVEDYLPYHEPESEEDEDEGYEEESEEEADE